MTHLTTQQSKTHGDHSKVATVGGTLALFVGMSVVSMFEVMFFFLRSVHVLTEQFSPSNLPIRFASTFYDYKVLLVKIY